MLDPPIRRKIKAPLGFYGVTSDHKFGVKKVYNMAARGVGLFDSSDEAGFWGFTREDIPLRGEESDSNASGESDFSLSEASEQESSEESEDEDADETRGVEIYEKR